MRVNILGVPIDAVRREEALARAERFLEEPRGHFVATPNPEMLVAANQDPDFRRILGLADLAIPDGFGLVVMARQRGVILPERVTGTDFLDDLAGLAAKKGKTVFLLGGEGDISRRAADILERRHPGLKVVGTLSGGMVGRDEGGALKLDPGTDDAIRAAAPDILFVAFGHGKQEEWISRHLPVLPSVRLAMGVGGAFDFIAGRVPRAPEWFRRRGLEWLWRLAMQPRRIGRIWTAVVVFPWLALTEKR